MAQRLDTAFQQTITGAMNKKECSLLVFVTVLSVEGSEESFYAACACPLNSFQGNCFPRPHPMFPLRRTIFLLRWLRQSRSKPQEPTCFLKAPPRTCFFSLKTWDVICARRAELVRQNQEAANWDITLLSKPGTFLTLRWWRSVIQLHRRDLQRVLLRPHKHFLVLLRLCPHGM